MPDTIYIEEEVSDHPRTVKILQRFPKVRTIICQRYGEIFNRKAQNFRVQKQKPALILARKHRQHVLAAPDNYHIGSQHNYYFSHMLNCPYDCRYCFLQGMYRSAHHVLFVNYEDFMTTIAETSAAHTEPTWFFSGYDCDSLAYEPVSGFAKDFLPFFHDHPQAWLELRTKSVQTRCLENSTPLNNCVIAFSFTPDNISTALEHGVPATDKRIAAIRRLQQQGWKIGLRFDPLIYHDDYRQHYQQLYEAVFAAVDIDKLHSVSLGGFRLPKPFFQRMQRLYPDEKLFAGPLDHRESMVTYPAQQQQDMQAFCTEALLRYIPEQLLFPCT